MRRSVTWSVRRWLPAASCALALSVAAVTASCSDEPGEDGAPGSGGTTPAGAGGASAGSGAPGPAGAPSAGSASGGRADGGGGAGGSSAPGSAGEKASGGAASGGMAGSTSSAGSSAGGAAAGGGAGATAMGGTSGVAGGSGGAPATGGVAAVISGGVRWVGRVDVSSATAQRFGWSGTGFVATVTGDTISVKLKSEGDAQPVFFQPVIGGMPRPRVSVAAAEGEKTVVLGSGLGPGDHRVELYRETEGKPGFATSSFLGFAAGMPKEPPPYSGRLIEIVGDSISAGYGNLGAEQHPNGGDDPSGGCAFTTETQSAYKTYGAIAARALEADVSIIAASGWGVYTDNGGNTSNVLKNLYSNTLGGQGTPAWSFTQKPQAVVVNLGTNDFTANMTLAEGPFSAAYEELLATIRSKNPDALILCAIGPLLYGTGLTNARAYIPAIVAKLKAAGDDNIKVLDFGQQDASKGTGCSWHPNVAENERMAAILVQELRAFLDR